ncbi:MAG TPA: phosphate ABC transporter substrate-binding protein PstS [Gemmataceae bacterium]|jgi:phosphate ABC transporter phosphate-binding protein|nr:phosphate ABC transporter substrate-binding protein PstS [Gemmataceae bacterium]
MAPPTTATDFRMLIEQSGLLSVEQLAPYFTENADPEAIAEHLVADRMLTQFQCRQLQKGRADGFFLTDKYKILDLIGSGGMGKVYLCEHLILHRLVAIKLLQPPTGPGSEAARSYERFYREARAVAALNDPNIIRVFDVDRVGPNPFMVMEFADGTNMHEVISENGPLSPVRAAEYIRQAALGLQHANEVGLVHRDIKPGNLILTRSGVVKVLDLGLARFTQDPVRNQGITDRYDKHIVIGTVDFMAPEQAFETSAVDIRSDIYGLGCTLYFLLTGRVPFPDRSIPEKMYAHKTRAPAPVSELVPRVPADLMEVLDKMMAKEPADRHQTPAEVVQALAPLVTDGVAPPPVHEMPAQTFACYQLGLSPAPGPTSAAMAPTPNPLATSDTDRTPKPGAWDLPGYNTPQPRPAPADTGADPSILLATPPPTSGGTRLRSARRFRRLVRLGELVLFVLAAGGVGWLASREWMHAPRTNVAQPVAPITVAPKEAPPQAFAGRVLAVGGVTFADPVLQRWSGVYEKTHDVRLDYQPVGQEKGVDRMLDGLYPFACAVIPLDNARLGQARGDVFHIPLALGTVAVAYNLAEVKGDLQFTGAVLAEIYLGNIKRWNDQKLQACNPTVTLPDLPINVIYHGEPNGTTELWNSFLSKTNRAWADKPATPVWPVGEGAKANAGTAARISRTPGSIGYLELSFALSSSLKVGHIQNHVRYVRPSSASAAAALNQVVGSIPADLRYSLIDIPGDDAYPITGTVWAILYADQTQSPAAKDMLAFLRWAIHDGQSYVTELQFGRLPPELVQRIDDRLDELRIPR